MKTKDMSKEEIEEEITCVIKLMTIAVGMWKLNEKLSNEITDSCVDKIKYIT